MAKPAEKIKFQTTLEEFPGRKGWYIFPVPFSVEKKFGTKDKIRVIGTLNGIPIDRSLIPLGDGTHYILLPGAFRRKAKLNEGDAVEIIVSRADYDDDPEMPEELLILFNDDSKAKTRFKKLQPGIKRAIRNWIEQGKRPETRANRAVEILRRLNNPAFHFGGKKVD